MDNPIDINEPIELRRKQGEENAMPHPVDASIEKVNLNGNLCYWVSMPDVNRDEVFFFIHGGGYTMGSAESSFCLASWISLETKSTVFSINDEKDILQQVPPTQTIMVLVMDIMIQKDCQD